MIGKILTVVGARPQFIKAAPVSRAFGIHDGLEELMVHTGQHFDASMSGIFFDELGIPAPGYNLDINGGGHGEMTGRMLEALEKIMLSEKPDMVLVYGDTNSTLATALAASKLLIPLAHVEAGLRSFNRSMPEEVNRVLTDHVSDLLFCPTSSAVSNLASEGIDKGVYNVGDVMFDAARYAFQEIGKKPGLLETLGLTPGRYAVATLHRAENADYDEILRQLLANLEKVSEAYQVPVVFPVHPRTRSRIEELELTLPGCIRMIDPVGFFDFLLLEQNALLVLTDSGGVQEECCILQVPCITLRDDTERPETLEAGGNLLVGRTTKDLVIHVKEMLNRPRNWINPLGDGEVASHMIDTLLELNTK